MLLVDDHPPMRRVLRGVLEDAGMEVVGEAADGLEGVAQAEAVRPDVVLMDWRMPRLDGVQATAPTNPWQHLAASSTQYASS